jgi:hypothetical protein
MEISKLVRKLLNEQFDIEINLDFNAGHYKKMVRSFLRTEPMETYGEAVIFSYYSEDQVNDGGMVYHRYVPHIYLVGNVNWEVAEDLCDKFRSFLEYYGLPNFSVSMDTWYNFRDDQARYSKEGLKRPYYEIDCSFREKGVTLDSMVKYIRYCNAQQVKSI